MEESLEISGFLRLKKEHVSALRRLGLFTLKDLLFFFPTRYIYFTDRQLVKDLLRATNTTLYGTIHNLKLGKSFRKKLSMAEGIFSDETGNIKLVWFNQPYLAKMINENSPVRISGRVQERNGEIYIGNPEVEPVSEIPFSNKESLFRGEAAINAASPVYRETRGITSRWLYHAIQKIIKEGLHEKIPDPIPAEILEKYNLPKLSLALLWIHFPRKEADVIAARKRFAFEEVFYIQLAVQKERLEYKKQNGFKIDISKENIDNFLARFPFEATRAQKRSITTILEDFQKLYPMSRLLEGDVGSGKTAVAATTAYAVVAAKADSRGIGRLQVAYMAPTEILAEQHFESFIEYFKHLPINIGLITGSGCKKFPSKVNSDGVTTISRAQLLKWVSNGEISILVGTHALIQKSVSFKNLAYIIIDEQHRFGTKQRQKLARKTSPVPHLLSMSATPIPRTLALTIYGDLDLSILDESPLGRKPIITESVLPSKRQEVYEKLELELETGRQIYVICPRINDPDPDKENSLIAKSVKTEAEYLSEKVFPKFRIDILHSKMKPKEKELVMTRFKNHEIDILVATSVVEVGVNVPNATSIIIEGAERFGLAQLHQLRGRVLRSSHQAYCYLFSESAGEKTSERLKALVSAKNGFELSELDLNLRGSGELLGSKQWGISDIGMEAIKNIRMVEAARLEAARLVDRNTIKDYPSLTEKIAEKSKSFHFE